MTISSSEIFLRILKLIPLLGFILNGGLVFSQVSTDSLIELAKEYRYEDPIQAYFYANQALSKADDSKSLARIYYQLGILLRNAGEFDSAYANLLTSWRLGIAIDDLVFIGNSLNAMGTVLSASGQHRLALEKYKESLEIRQQNNSKPSSINRIWQNLANVYNDLGKLDSSKLYLDLQKTYLKEHGSYIEMTDYYINYGAWHQMSLRFDSSGYYFRKALFECQSQNDTLEMITVLCDLATSDYERGNYSESLKNLRLAKTFGNKLGEISDLAISNLHVIFSATQQYDSAYYYLQLQKQLEDSLFTTQQANHLNLLRTLHEVESTNRQKQILAANNRALMFSLIFAGAIALSLLIGLYLNQRKRTAEKSLLLAREANIQTDMISRLHIQEAEAMQRMNFRLEEEYQKVARSLHDQLGNLLVTARLNVQGLIDQLPAQTKTSQQQFQIADQSLENALQAIRQIAHQMHEGRINQLGLDSVLQELKTTVETSGKLKVELDLIGLDQHLDANRERLVFQIIRELTTNVIKYAQATELSIQIVREADQIEIMIADNGQGFPLDFSPHDYGLGLRSVQTDLAKLGGTIEIDSQPQHGATIIIDMPI